MAGGGEAHGGVGEAGAGVAMTDLETGAGAASSLETGNSATGAAAPAAAVATTTEDNAALDPGREAACGLKYSTEHWQLMPFAPEVYKNDMEQIRTELLVGVTIAFAQVAESIAFSFIAGVGPLVGLHAAWIVGLIIALTGTRTGMINGATGVRAAVVAPYVSKYGTEFLFYIVIGSSIFQLLAYLFRVAKYVRMIPQPAMIGFVNGLGIILALGQVRQFKHPDSDLVWLPTETILWMWFLALCTVAGSIYLRKLPKIGSLLPPSLFGILAAVVVEFAIVRPSGFSTPSIGDLGKVQGAFPQPIFTDPRYKDDLPTMDWHTLEHLLEPAFVAAAAGIVETLMTMEVVNDLTESENPHPDQQMLAMAVANFIGGIFGTMGGDATIGLTVINCHNGSNGKYRISAITAAVVLLLLILAAAPVIELVPTASLVGVMIIVVYHTIEWDSLWMILVSCMPLSVRQRFGWARKIQRIDAFIIVMVMAVTLLVDLFVAVFIGVLMSSASFAWKQGGEMEVFSQIVEVDADTLDPRKHKTVHVDAEGVCTDDLATGTSAVTGVAASSSKSNGSAGVSQGTISLQNVDKEVATAMTPWKGPGGDGVILGGGSPDPNADEHKEAEKDGQRAPDAVAEDGDKPKAAPGKRLVKIVHIHGPVFFASAMALVKKVNPSRDDPDDVEIHFHRSAISDYTGIHAMNVLGEKYKALGKTLHLRRLNDVSIRQLQKADQLAEHFTYEIREEAEDEEVDIPHVPAQMHVTQSYRHPHPHAE